MVVSRSLTSVKMLGNTNGQLTAITMVAVVKT